DAAPLTVYHALNDLLGYIEQTVQIGIDDGTPVFLAHFSEQAIAGDARIIDQHINRPQFIAYFFKCIRRGVPVGYIAHRGMKLIAQGCLLINPLLEISARSASGHDGVAFFGQSLAYGCSYAPHTPCHVSQFSAHFVLLGNLFIAPAALRSFLAHLREGYNAYCLVWPAHGP